MDRRDVRPWSGEGCDGEVMSMLTVLRRNILELAICMFSPAKKSRTRRLWSASGVFRRRVDCKAFL